MYLDITYNYVLFLLHETLHEFCDHDELCMPVM
jgi:hypothetical protein